MREAGQRVTDPGGRFSDRRIAYFLLRLALGTSMFWHGAGRIAAGADQFAGGLVKQFAATPLPAPVVRTFGLALPWVEAAIGACLILGLFTRAATIVGGLQMSVLIFGSTLKGDYNVVAIQLSYSLLFSILLAARSWNAFALDELRPRDGQHKVADVNP